MRHLLADIVAGIVVCVALFGVDLPCSAQPASAPATAPAPKADMDAVVAAQRQFALELYARLAGEKGNVCFSPGSIHTALTMTYAGAAGRTAVEVAKTLHLDDTRLDPSKLHEAMAGLLQEWLSPEEIDDQPAYELSMANGIWLLQGLKIENPFRQLLEKNYRGQLSQVDFSQSEPARKAINDWAAGQTKGRIRELLPPGSINSLSRMVLADAIYFKAAWEEKFNKRSTGNRKFRLAADKGLDAPMMYQESHLAYAETKDVQAVELAYRGDELAMVILLPRKVEGLGELEKALSPQKLGELLKELKEELVQVTLPRFTITSALNLSVTLSQLGMPDAFTDKADFSKITSAEKLFLSGVYHQAFVTVDEDGTEAAGATAVAAAAEDVPAGPKRPFIFLADHPFIFLIRHNPTDSILFMGRLAEPK